MAVNLSPIWGAGAQLLDNSGNVLSGGKIYTYAAGTTTQVTTYTSNTGVTANSNPIVLNSAGRVPYEIWLTDGQNYKFVLKDSNDVLIGTWDNLSGINSNFIAYTNQQEIQTATAGQTVFNLTTMNYLVGTNSLSVFVDGVNQYGPGAQYAYEETDSNTVTFASGLHVGAEVKFTSSQIQNAGVTDASQISYDPSFTDFVPTNVEDQLNLTINASNFGTDIGIAINAAIAALPAEGGIVDCRGFSGDCATATTITADKPVKLVFGAVNMISSASPLFVQQYQNLTIEGVGPYATKFTSTTDGAHGVYVNPVPITPSHPLAHDQVATLTIDGVYFYDSLTADHTSTRTSGNAIHNTYPAPAGGSAAIYRLNNIEIYGFYDGVHIEQSTTGTVQDVNSFWAQRYGFCLAGTTTSMNFTSTYAFASQADGYNFTNAIYCTLNNTACDAPWGNGYSLTTCYAVTLNSVGCEQPASGIASGSAILLSGSQEIVINSPFLIGHSTAIGAAFGLTTLSYSGQACRSVIINGGYFGNAGALNQFTGYGINIAANSHAGKLPLIGNPIVGGDLGNINDPSFSIEYVSDNPSISTFTAFAQTTNATATVLYSDPIGADTMALYEATVTAIQTGGSSGAVGTSAGYQGKEVIKVIGGVMSAVGAGFVDTFSEEDSSAWNMYFDPAAGALVVKVVGEANKTIKWRLQMTKNYLTTAAYPAV